MKKNQAECCLFLNGCDAKRLRGYLAGVAAIFIFLFNLSVPTGWTATALCSMHDGKAVDGKTVLEKQGKKYEFCCSGCLQQFKESPEMFETQMQSPALSIPSSPEAACSTVCSD